MITSTKDWPRYYTTCDCKNRLGFISNKPPGDSIEVICECYEIHRLEIPEAEGKHRYRSQAKTEQLRCAILEIFAGIKMRMTVRQVYYQLVVKKCGTENRFRI